MVWACTAEPDHQCLSLDGTLQCMQIMSQSIVQENPKSFTRQRNGIFSRLQATLKAQQNILREETQHLMMWVGSRLKATFGLKLCNSIRYSFYDVNIDAQIHCTEANYKEKMHCPKTYFSSYSYFLYFFLLQRKVYLPISHWTNIINFSWLSKLKFISIYLKSSWITPPTPV